MTFLKLLLDEMCAGLKEYFETLGWDVIAVQDIGLQGTTDRTIVEYANRHDLLIVTRDQKPADLADMLGVRCVFISNGLIAKMVDSKIRDKYPALEFPPHRQLV